MVLKSTVRKDMKEWIANQFKMANWIIRGLAQETKTYSGSKFGNKGEYSGRMD